MKFHPPNHWNCVLTLLILMAAFSSGCSISESAENASEIPTTVLWAWERPEDLRFLKEGENVGVAFLAQTLELEKDFVTVRQRRQPLRVPESTYLIAVTRIESKRSISNHPVLSRQQQDDIVKSISQTLKLKNIRAVQIDFDAARSERKFYTEVLKRVRAAIPDNIPLSMTVLSSWCLGDRWLGGLPVDEFVPMVFDMGPDENAIKNHLSSGKDWDESRCRTSYGLAVYQPVGTDLLPDRRRYYFNNRPWKAADLKSLKGVDSQ